MLQRFRWPNVVFCAVLLTTVTTSNGFGQDRPTGTEQTSVNLEQDWPWWRGPWRNGVSPSKAAVPTQWSESKNIVWKAPVPGRGHASPVIVGDRIALATADDTKQTQSVVAFDRKTGKQLWSTEISREGFPKRIHPNNTHASPTIASDGEQLFVSFFHHDTVQVTALDWNGKKQWQKSLGEFTYNRYEYGYAPSPVIYRNTLILAAESDTTSFLTALDRKTGSPVWKTPRPVNISYSSPSVAKVAGRDQLFMSGADQMASYDPATGKSLWTTPGIAAATCGTAVWDSDIVIASGGYPKAETLAVRASNGEEVWKNKQKCYEQSLLAYNGYVYGLTDGGVLYCWRTADGKEMWKQRLQGPVSASPVLAGGHIYWANELGTMYVFKPNPEKLELVAENKLGDESFASPAVSNGQIFLRVSHGNKSGRSEFLYCVGQ